MREKRLHKGWFKILCTFNVPSILIDALTTTTSLNKKTPEGFRNSARSTEPNAAEPPNNEVPCPRRKVHFCETLVCGETKGWPDTKYSQLFIWAQTELLRCLRQTAQKSPSWDQEVSSSLFHFHWSLQKGGFNGKLGYFETRPKFGLGYCQTQLQKNCVPRENFVIGRQFVESLLLESTVFNFDVGHSMHVRTSGLATRFIQNSLSDAFQTLVEGLARVPHYFTSTPSSRRTSGPPGCGATSWACSIRNE